MQHPRPHGCPPLRDGPTVGRPDGAQTQIGDLVIIGQGMLGATTIKPTTTVNRTELESAFLLLGWDFGAWRLAGRVDQFGTNTLSFAERLVAVEGTRLGTDSRPHLASLRPASIDGRSHSYREPARAAHAIRRRPCLGRRPGPILARVYFSKASLPACAAAFGNPG